MGGLPLEKLKARARRYMSGNEMVQAATALAEANERFPEDAETWCLLGIVDNASDRPAQAEVRFREALKRDPRSTRAWFGLGVAQIEQSQYASAVSSLEQCLELDAGLLPARLRLSGAREQLGQWRQARIEAAQVLESEPGNLPALKRVARMSARLDDLEGARSCYEQVVRQAPDDVQSVTALADLYLRQGDIDQAIGFMRPLLRDELPPNAVAFLYSDICQFIGECEQAAALIEKLLANSKQPRARHRRLIYALAKLYDRLGQYDRAFECVSEANRLKRAEHPVPATAGQADRVTRVWTREFFASLPRSPAGEVGPTPVFIIGMPRSGTSLTEQILASHPAVFGAGELTLMDELRNRFFGPGSVSGMYPSCLETTPVSILQAFREAYMESLPQAAGNTGIMRVTDKLPENFWNLGLIRLVFPDARIIHCTRNPRDTCISCFFADFRDGHEYTTGLESLGVYYGEYIKIMRHWQSALEIPVHEVRYEDMVETPEQTSRALVECCGLEWDERCLEPYKTHRDVNTASFAQVRHKIYASSVARWKNYESHIKALNAALGFQSGNG